MTSQPSQFPLEPLGVGESLDAGFRLWRRNFLAFFLLSLIAVAPGQILSAVYNITNIRSITAQGELIVDDPTSFLVASLLVSLAGLTIQAIGWSALMYYGVRAYIGQPVDLGAAVRGAVRRIIPFIALSVLFFIMVGIGLVLLLLPGVYLGVLFVLAFPAFFAEGIGPAAALSRGRQLASGRWWRIFALLLLAWLVAAFLGFIISGLVLNIELTTATITRFYVLAAVLGTILGALFNPLIPSMLIVAYFDGRVRHEGFDIEMMAQQLDEPHVYPPDDSIFG